MLRFARDFLINSAIAFLGVAISELSVYAIYRPRTIAAAYVKEILVSATVALVLGFIVYFKWRQKAALWIWTIGVVLFLWRLATQYDSDFWTRSILAYISVRAVFYSLGAICCSLLPTQPISEPLPSDEIADE